MVTALFACVRTPVLAQDSDAISPALKSTRQSTTSTTAKSEAQSSDKSASKAPTNKATPLSMSSTPGLAPPLQPKLDTSNSPDAQSQSQSASTAPTGGKNAASQTSKGTAGTATASQAPRNQGKSLPISTVAPHGAGAPGATSASSGNSGQTGYTPQSDAGWSNGAATSGAGYGMNQGSYAQPEFGQPAYNGAQQNPMTPYAGAGPNQGLNQGMNSNRNLPTAAPGQGYFMGAPKASGGTPYSPPGSAVGGQAPGNGAGRAPGNTTGGPQSAQSPMGGPMGTPGGPMGAPGGSLGTAGGPNTAGTQGQPEDSYPVIGTLESSVFGSSTPQAKIEDRLAKLENAVYKKTFALESLFDRTERLKTTLLGAQPPEPQNTSSQFVENGGGQGMQSYFDSIAALPENQTEVPIEEMERYFAFLINNERQKFGYAALTPDTIAQKVAQDQATDLATRRVLSHQDANGNNPDRRYTLAGGTDLVAESLVALISDYNVGKHTRSNVAKMVKTLMNRQDDRDAILSGDATGLGFGMDWTKEKDKLLGCIEVVTHHGVIQPIPLTVPVGEKVEVKGVVLAPFHFEKVTVAWEEKNPTLSAAPPESDEALPYFAPLDYVAHAHHSDNDHQTAITVLKTAGIVAAIAGGVFMPPVALAAPIIAMSGPVSEPKPASDIPVKGGVKLDGNAFDAKVPCNHEGKEGIYYVTVWGSLTKYGKPVAISRRAILATSSGASESVQATQTDDATLADNSSKPKAKVKKKHKHDDSTQADPPTTNSDTDTSQ